MDDTHDYLDANHLRGGIPPDSVGVEEPVPSSQTQGRALKIAQRLFMAALFLLPFIFIPVAGWSVVVGKGVMTAVLGGAAGAAVFGSMFTRAFAVPKTYSAFLLGIFVVVLLSTVFTESLAASLFGSGLEVGTFFTTAVALAIALIAPLVLVSREQLVTALMALFAGGAVLGLFHVVRLAFGPDVLSFGYFTQPVSTPAGTWNDLGIFFGVTYLIALTGIVFGRVPNATKTILGSIAVVSLVFVALVNFQFLAVMLALATLALLVILLMTRRNNALFPAVAGFLFLVVLGLFSGPMDRFMGELMDASYGAVRPSWSSTQMVLGSSLSDIKGATLGTGPNTFMYLWQENRPQTAIESNLWSFDFAFAAGIIPTFAITFGLLATALMLGFAGYLALRVFRVMEEEGADSLLATVAVSTGLAAVFLWVVAIFYVFSVTIFLLMFMLSGISAAALTQLGRMTTVSIGSTTRPGLLSGIAGASVCTLIVVAALTVGVSRTIYGQGVVQANTAESIEGVAEAQEKIQLASMLERNDAFARTETELGLIRIQEFFAREDATESDMPAFREVVAATQNAARRAQMINARDYRNWVNSGLVYETLGVLEVERALDLAEQSYARASQLNPTNPELVLMQARLAQLRGNSEEAKAFAEQAAQLKPDYTNAYMLLSDIALANEDLDEAAEHLQAGIEAIAGNSLLSYQLGLIHYAESEYVRALSAFTDAIISDPEYANARYFRALTRVYAGGSREEALADLAVVRENNPDNEVLAEVIANVEAGNNPLEGIADESALPSLEEDTTPATNTDFIEDLETQGDPQVQTEPLDGSQDTPAEESVEQESDGEDQ